MGNFGDGDVASQDLFQSSREHQRDHLVIAHERPEWIFKSRWLVLFDHKMRKPSAAITRNEAEQEEPPSSRRDEIDYQCDASRRADEVQPASRWTAVLRQVKRPEFRK